MSDEENELSQSSSAITDSQTRNQDLQKVDVQVSLLKRCAWKGDMSKSDEECWGGEMMVLTPCRVSKGL